MAQTKTAKKPSGSGAKKAEDGLNSLHRVTDTLSAMLAKEVRGLSARQKAAQTENGADPATMKGLKEATAVLKDLAAVAKTLNEQGTDAGGAVSGVVVLPPVEKP